MLVEFWTMGGEIVNAISKFETFEELKEIKDFLEYENEESIRVSVETSLGNEDITSKVEQLGVDTQVEKLKADILELDKEQIEKLFAAVYDSEENEDLEKLKFADLPIKDARNLVDGGVFNLEKRERSSYAI